MGRPRLLVPWLRRGLEAGAFAALLSGSTLAAFVLSRPEPRISLPSGVDGALMLIPAVLALAVFAISYPTFLAATRSDAIFGAIAAFLVAADLLAGASWLFGIRVFWSWPLDQWILLGLLATIVAAPVALAGLLVGQLSSPLGFGRSAAFRSAGSGLVLSVIFVLWVIRFS